jgi:pimeloyl-ACP methyl ester carboxylesterase
MQRTFTQTFLYPPRKFVTTFLCSKHDSSLSAFDVFVVDFPSPKLSASLSIDEAAEYLRLDLESHGVLNHQEIIFVCHSMGGVVTRAYLIKYREVAKKVRMLYFLSTPTTGSFIASAASLVSRNPQFKKMSVMTSDSYLADVVRTWLASSELTALPSFCAYEVQSTFGVKVVEQQSAAILCNRPLDPIDRNHIDIAKPRGPTDVPYLAVKSAYRATAPPPPLPPKPAPPGTRTAPAAAQKSALRFEAQSLKQIKKRLEDQPKLKGQVVFCDSMRLTLLVGLAQTSTTPVLVKSISVHSEPIPEGSSLKPGSCDIDTLSSTPYGIIETETFLIQSDEAGVSARFIQNAKVAFPLDTDNLLRLPATARAITLKPGEEPVAFNILLQSTATTPQRIWFTADYDEAGQRTASTGPIFLWR